MSTRRRPRPRANTYTDRLYRRGGGARHPVSLWAAKVVAPLAGRRLAALLVLGVELGHLSAALIEWPASVPRGGFHVLAAAAAGLLAVAVYCGRRRVELVLGLVLSLALPTAWLAGLSYRDYPGAAAVSLSALEVILAGLLVVLLTAAAAPPPPPTRRNAPRRERVANRS